METKMKESRFKIAKPNSFDFDEAPNTPPIGAEKRLSEINEEASTPEPVFVNLQEPMTSVGINRPFGEHSKSNSVKFMIEKSGSFDQSEPLLEKNKKKMEPWIDENGLIIKKEQNNTDDEEANAEKKSFKIHYSKEDKSLQFSIDMRPKKSKENGCFSQLKCASFYQALIAEFLGTYLLVLFAVGFGLKAEASDVTAPLAGSLASGFMVATLVWGIGHISGANINPAVSLALLVTGESNIIRILLYIPCQLIGSCLAILTLKDMVDDDIPIIPNSLLNNTETKVAPIQIGLTLLHPSVSPFQGFLVEAVITFILILTVFSCIDKHRKDLHGSFPHSIGFAITVGALFGGKFTGGSMNPARSFGPALVANNFTDHYIYWVGPCTGAVVAAITYKVLVFKTSMLTSKIEKS